LRVPRHLDGVTRGGHQRETLHRYLRLVTIEVPELVQPLTYPLIDAEPARPHALPDLPRDNLGNRLLLRTRLRKTIDASVQQLLLELLGALRPRERNPPPPSRDPFRYHRHDFPLEYRSVVEMRDIGIQVDRTPHHSDVADALRVKAGTRAPGTAQHAARPLGANA